jgi:hypothetical protein
MLSVNPTLTENEIRTILRNTCDKIGGVTYVNGTHPEYGVRPRERRARRGERDAFAERE